MVVVVEFDEAEAALFARVLLGQPGDVGDGAELGEVLPEVLVLDVLLDPADKDLLDRLAGLRLAAVLAGSGALCLNLRYKFNIDVSYMMLRKNVHPSMKFESLTAISPPFRRWCAGGHPGTRRRPRPSRR